MNFWKKYSLLFVVFCTGAIVLVIEVAAVRILSPYFGNTIFSVSSVLSVVLAALSIGYYVGGKMADKKPYPEYFYGLIFVSGMTVLVMHFLNIVLLPKIGYILGIISGPLISSFILFFIPSVFLGMLSPFAVKLQSIKDKEEGVGSVAGQVFFYSTLGSIFGSLLTGFVLIPRMGLDKIVISSAVILIFLGLIPVLRVKKNTKKLIIFLFLLVVLPFLFFPKSKKNINVLYEKDGVYEKLTIYNSVYNGHPIRILQQDKSNSGAMFLDSNDLVYDYTKYYALHKLFKPELKNALVMGGGAYSVPKKLLEESDDVIVDVSEIEPSLFDLSKKYFNLPDSDRLNNYLEDARRMLHDRQEKYDFIFSDVYHSLYSVPSHFTTEEFFEMSKKRLSDNGVFVANFIGNLSRVEPSLLFSEMHTFSTVFPNSYFFSVTSPGQNTNQNIIFVGINGDKKIDWESDFIKNNPDEIIRNLKTKHIDTDRFNISKYIKLKDNYAPVDYFLINVLKKEYDKDLDGEEMMAIVEQQLSYGARHPSATGHEQVKDFLIKEMEVLATDVVEQTWMHKLNSGEEVKLTNVIARFGVEKENRIILGAHYDSKKFADRDLENPRDYVPGANDSASGVAVLIEVARKLSYLEAVPNVGVDIVFFDGEEGDEDFYKNTENFKCLGSEYFAENIDDIYDKNKPIQGLIVDMVGDRDLNILIEKTSYEQAPVQVESFWNLAQRAGFKNFEKKQGASLTDDHTALNRIGIPSFLVIDFDYDYFHTTEDTLDKCSAKSLEIVGNAVLNYIYSL